MAMTMICTVVPPPIDHQFRIIAWERRFYGQQKVSKSVATRRLVKTCGNTSTLLLLCILLEFHLKSGWVANNLYRKSRSVCLYHFLPTFNLRLIEVFSLQLYYAKRVTVTFYEWSDDWRLTLTVSHFCKWLLAILSLNLSWIITRQTARAHFHSITGSMETICLVLISLWYCCWICLLLL